MNKALNILCRGSLLGLLLAASTQALTHSITSTTDTSTRTRVGRNTDQSKFIALSDGNYQFSFFVGPFDRRFTSTNAATRITGVGFNFAGSYPDFQLESDSGGQNFTLVNDVPSGLPGIDLDFALLTSDNSFEFGEPAAGLAPDDVAIFSVVGRFPQPPDGPLTYDNADWLVDHVIVRFETPGSEGTVRRIGFGSPAAMASVPEPSTWAMMLIGFGSVGYVLRRRPARRFSQAI